MAEHNIALGGQRTINAGFYEMLPSVPPPQDGVMVPTSHKDSVTYSLTRHLEWKAECQECPRTGQATGSMALASYLERFPIVAGDVLNIVIMPRWTSLTKVWWMIKEPLEGFTFDLQIKGTSNSLGGTEDAPAPIVIASDIDAAAAAVTQPDNMCLLTSGVIGIDPAAQGDPNCGGIYFDQNDMLQMVIKTLPPEGILCSELCISPVVDAYCEGKW